MAGAAVLFSGVRCECERTCETSPTRSEPAAVPRRRRLPALATSSHLGYNRSLVSGQKRSPRAAFAMLLEAAPYMRAI